MTLRNGTPLTFRPRTLCDALDGGEAPTGAMASLANLIPDKTTNGVFQARPAAVRLTAFPGFSSPGFISSAFAVGDILYGTIASARNPGKDEPFAYNMEANSFLVIAGITAGNTPLSPPSSGDWTPPVLAQVGGRVIATHPGFPGGLGPKFGWFDVSGFNQQTACATVAGAPFLFGSPATLGVQPGDTVTGAGIPAATLTVGIFPNAIGASSFTVDTHTTVTIDNMSVNSNLFYAGSSIVGPGIQPGTTIIGFPSSSSMTLSLPTTSSLTGNTFIVPAVDTPTSEFQGQGTFVMGNASVTVTQGDFIYPGQLLVPDTGNTAIGPNTYVVSITSAFPKTMVMSQPSLTGGGFNFHTNGSVIQISQPATATSSGTVTVTIAGGTKTAPLWGAGDCDINPLPSMPVGVAQMNGRAWYACGTDGIVFSDPGVGCRVSNNPTVQALTTSDGLPVTAIGALQLSSLLGGIVQSLIAFEGVAKMQQISGDPVTNNLTMSALPVSTGTLSPLSLCSTERGLMFISPEGLRLIDFGANVSPPIGEAGTGVAAPFISAAHPSRICAAARADTVRISVQPAGAAGPSEFWFDLSRKIWTGPHSFPASLIQPWRGSFAVAPSGITGSLWQSDVVAGPSSVYVENGSPLTWTWQPSLLPDAGTGHMVDVIEMTEASALPPGTGFSVSAIINIDPLTGLGTTLDTTTVADDAGAVFRQRSVDWHIPLVFRQATFKCTGNSVAGMRVGSLYMNYQLLNYKLEASA